MANNDNLQNVYIPKSSITDELGGCIADIYDFSIHGGAVGTLTLPAEIPDNAIITDAYVDVLVDLTSGGSATVAIGLNTTTDILAATAIASVTGVVVAKQGADAFKLTADRKLQVTIATAALTAGKMAIYVKWVGPFDNVVPR
ncbi:hypothetical protein Lepto7375DRAFT_7292 [Leptolyngbya sp. PCC 7375]|nr:hypothetical protein Lepto7375DRAFT_7292 [Leptolyngbya sp. PCC 7375]